jgi:trigger factor
MELSDLAEGQPFSFKATVYLPPRVELGDYSSVSVERPVVTVTDADVDEEVERTRREFARLVPVEGRGIQEHDWVIGDLLIEMEGQSTPPEPRRTLIRLGDNIPGFDEAILGMAVGDERTFTLVYPEDHQDENLRGKPATFTLKVGSIQERILPEVSDVWVRMTLGLPNVEEWRAVLRERLQQSAREVSQRLVMDRIVEELISRSTVEYPRNMLLDTAQEELNDMREQLGERGITLEQYMRANNLTRDQLEKDILDRAAHQLKAQLVLAELAKKEQVRVTQEEIDAEFDALLANADASDPSVKRLRKSERRREQVGNRILRRKVTDCLLRIATITDVELTDDARQPSEAAPPSEPGGKEQ